jgi:transcriptional regulator with XRE-family HTH domain
MTARTQFGPNALRRLRGALSFDGRRPATQREVAAAIGVGLDRYYKLENGHEPPTAREVTALARVFGVSGRRLGLEKPRESRRVVVREGARDLGRAL